MSNPTPPSDPPHPDEVRAALAAAEQRAAEALAQERLANEQAREQERLATRKKIRKWVSLGVLIFVVQSTGVAVILGFVIANQRTQAENSANGRTTLQTLLAFSDPTSKTYQALQARQATQTARALTTLRVAEQTDVADVLRRVGEWMQDLGVPQSEIARVQSEPLPSVTFTVTPAPSLPPIPRPTPTPSPTRSSRAAGPPPRHRLDLALVPPPN